METNCSTRPPTTTHTCAVAPQFANVGVEIERVLQRRPAALASSAARGIVVVVPESSSSSSSAITTLMLERLRQLRRVGCRLPVEIWAAASSTVDLYALQRNAEALALRPIHVRHLPSSSTSSTSSSSSSSSASMQQLLIALRLTAFAQALYLDLSSAVVLRDPTPLFSSATFAMHGAVFWPHVHHERTTERNLQRSSWLWELLDLPFVDALEQDPRVLLLDRRHAGVAAALELAEWLAREPLIEQLALVPDGSDLLRLAWRRRRVAFAVVETPPSVVGTLSGAAAFCGTHVLQHDADGAPWVLLPRLAPPEALGHLPAKRLEALHQLTHVQRYDVKRTELTTRRRSAAASQSGYDVQSVVVDGGSATCLRGGSSLWFTTEALATDVVSTLRSVQGSDWDPTTAAT
ncbi:hypothetical protein PINS_up013051 [Pythium insidiosum]|nr:hypothetical protein PINS_up013051 [Pythium insidiosum]